MSFEKNELSVFEKSAGNAKLYSFLATDFSINALAAKICATQKARLNILSLKKSGNLAV